MKINKDTIVDILTIIVLPIMAALIVSVIVIMSGCTVNITKSDIESGKYNCRWEEGTLNCYDNWRVD
jgi:hypothetical protein